MDKKVFLFFLVVFLFPYCKGDVEVFLERQSELENVSYPWDEVDVGFLNGYSENDYVISSYIKVLRKYDRYGLNLEIFYRSEVVAFDVLEVSFSDSNGVDYRLHDPEYVFKVDEEIGGGWKYYAASLKDVEYYYNDSSDVPDYVSVKVDLVVNGENVRLEEDYNVSFVPGVLLW
ncbi:hypothetical protein [Salinibius halmophilus]|uniref:hypothetical protein n=1 Tax=Salinibius halmophilus TaxID=1853216 RepID=UPI000E6722F7|nr:hypothetical protein [Salinibius halmophilus]